MLHSKSSLESLLKVADQVARLVSAEKLFSWTVRWLSPPAGWLAWALRDEGDPTVVQPGGKCEREGVTGALFVRLQPVECVVEDFNLQSPDGHEFTGRLRLPVRIVPEPAELAAFRKTILSSGDILTRADLQRYLQWQARKVLSELAARHTAEELLKPADSAEVRKLVEQRLGAACLAGGLVIDEPVIAEFESDAYLDHRRHESDLARQQREADARSQIQQALAAAQNQRLSHLIAMLEQMREASKQHGERTLMELVQAFNPAERGQMYTALWHLVPTSRRTRFVAAVSGMEVLLFDPADLKVPLHRHRLPDSLGALRSVSADERSLEAGSLLVGAAIGVHVVDLETGTVRRELAAGDGATRPVRGGVNSVATSDRWILGSHSELGVMAWPRDDQGNATAARFLLTERTRGASTVRCLQVSGPSAWVAIDDRICRFWPDDPGAPDPVVYAGSRSPISALAVTRDAVYAANSEGEVLRWALDDPAGMAQVRRGTGTPIESLDIVDSSGVEWLIAADQQNALVTSVIGDNHACRYEAGSVRVRRAAVAEDLFVAMNDNRDRLIAWRPDRCATPIGTVVVPYLTGGSIQDVCLVCV